jgi:ubiquinone/menaquinone biosynthesis C-methylase UbiE
MSERTKLKLLPQDRYLTANPTDPIRFYSYPIIGGLYRGRVEMCLEELSGGEKILEVGFGSGLTFLNLREKYREIHGIELEADVEAVTALWRSEGVETHLRRANVLELPYADATFDSVLLISILEHLKPYEQELAFREVRRVLKPGGQVVYGVPIERRFMAFMFRVLGYNVRELHFSTERDVFDAAASVMSNAARKQLRWPIIGAMYEVGHFMKRDAAS